jgi:hypothetical protein
LYPDIVHTWACDTEGASTKTNINANATEEIELTFIPTISMRRSLTEFSAFHHANRAGSPAQRATHPQERYKGGRERYTRAEKECRPQRCEITLARDLNF